jgi:hypothetical protein
MAGGVYTPYSTGVEFFGTKPSWIPDELDIQRIQSYQAYEEMYWNVPDTFKVSLRGTNDLPIYIPATRTIVDTTNRYYGADFRVAVNGVDGVASEASQAAAIALRSFMRREKFKSKYNGYKRYGLIHGDSVWHLTADETKAAGSRLRLTAIDPGMYFPIPDEEDVDRIVGVHLVEQITTADGPRIRRLTYRKGEPRPDGTSPITVEDGIFEVDKWGGPTDTPVTVIQQVTELPPQITSIPVYHTKNTEEAGNPFGSSEVRGLERIMGAMNQAVSDESLALALMGIGMYATDSSQPIDPKTKQPVAWRLGPGRVVHYDGTKWEKIQGVSNLADSYGEHYRRLWEALFRASSTPEVAVGSVDVSVAQSGIALSLQLGPMLAKAAEKNDLLIDTHNQLFYDIIQMWMPAYEATTFPDVEVDCLVGDAVPIDREARLTELNDMIDRGVIDTEYYRAEAKKLGYIFPDDIAARAKAEFDAKNAVADPFAGRVAEDLDDADDDGDS